MNSKTNGGWGEGLKALYTPPPNKIRYAGSAKGNSRSTAAGAGKRDWRLGVELGPFFTGNPMQLPIPRKTPHTPICPSGRRDFLHPQGGHLHK